MQVKNITEGKNFHDRLRLAIANAGIKKVDVASIVGAHPVSVSRWVKDRVPDQETVRKLAVALGVSDEWLLTGHDPRNERDKGATKVMEQIVDFPPKIIPDHPQRMMEITWSLARISKSYAEIRTHLLPTESIISRCDDENAFSLLLQSEDMEPRYFAGDHLVLMPEKPPRQQSLVVANSIRDGLFFRRLVWMQDGRFRLAAYNDRYPMVEYTRKELYWIFPVHATLRLEH